MPPVSDFEPLYQSAGQQYNVDPALLRAVVSVESGGNPTALSGAGASGVAQLMPATAAALGVKDSTDPSQAIPGAAKLLSQNLDRYGNVQDALQAYHGGTDQSNWGPLTKVYPGKVMAALKTNQPASAAPSSNDADAALLAAFTGGGTSTKPQANDAAPSAAPSASAPQLSDSDLLKAFTGPGKPAGETDAQMIVDQAPGVVGEHPLQSIRDAIANDPNKTYGNVLPFAKDNTTGNLARIVDPGSSDVFPNLENPDMGQGDRVAVVAPEMVRSPVRGLLDLVEGAYNASKGVPQPNTLTPDATNALMSLAGTRAGGAVPSAAESNALVRSAQAAEPIEAPLANSGNLLTGADATQAQGALPAADAASAGALKPVPKPILPIITKSQAGAQADRVLAHFASGGPTAIDQTALVPNSAPTLAQATGNAGIATLEKGLRSADPAFNNAVAAQTDASSAARLDALNGITGTPADIEAAVAERDASTAALRDKALQNATPVDSKPVVDLIDNILQSPAGQRDVVQSALTNIRSKLASPVGDGTFERYQMDPNQLYGIRKAINDSLSPLASGTDSDRRLAASELGQVKNALDGVIESGAPGFKEYINAYSKQSAPIDAMAYLQKQNLTDSQGNITLAKLDSTIKAVQKKQNLNGINDASSVTDDQLNGLVNLRADMRRAAVKPSGRVPGSDTFQNLATNSLTAQLTGNPLINLPIGALGAVSPTAAALSFIARSSGNKLIGRGNRMVNEALQDRLLNPSVGTNALTSKAKP